MKLEISAEDLAKVQRARARGDKTKVNAPWLYLAEFGYYYGWQGIEAIRNNEITKAEADKLLSGARKVWSMKVYDYATANLIGSASANSKKPSQTFKKLTQDLIKNTKADV